MLGDQGHILGSCFKREREGREIGGGRREREKERKREGKEKGKNCQ